MYAPVKEIMTDLLKYNLYMLRDTQLWNHIAFHPECNAIYAALD